MFHLSEFSILIALATFVKTRSRSSPDDSHAAESVFSVSSSCVRVTFLPLLTKQKPGVFSNTFSRSPVVWVFWGITIASIESCREGKSIVHICYRLLRENRYPFILVSYGHCIFNVFHNIF